MNEILRCVRFFSEIVFFSLLVIFWRVLEEIGNGIIFLGYEVKKINRNFMKKEIVIFCVIEIYFFIE